MTERLADTEAKLTPFKTKTRLCPKQASSGRIHLSLKDLPCILGNVHAMQGDFSYLSDLCRLSPSFCRGGLCHNLIDPFLHAWSALQPQMSHEDSMCRRLMGFRMPYRDTMTCVAKLKGWTA